MGKRVSCLNCENCMRFAVPNKKSLEESPYLLNQIKKTLVCGYTMKTKTVNNEQYCKHYIEAKEHTKIFNSEEIYNKSINERMK